MNSYSNQRVGSTDRSKAVANNIQSPDKGDLGSGLFEDLRPENILQQKIKQIASASAQKNDFNNSGSGVVQRLRIVLDDDEIDTDDFQKFSAKLDKLYSKNPKLVILIDDKLRAELKVQLDLIPRHAQHLLLLKKYVTSAKAELQLVLDDEKEKKEAAAVKKLEAAKKLQSKHTAIRKKYSGLPTAVLDQVFLQRPEPEEALLDVFNVVYTSKPGGERDSWADLILAGHFKGTISVDALGALVGSVAITFQICDRVIKNHTDVCTASRVARLIQALPLRGNGIPMAVSEPALCDYIFRRDATAQQLTLLSHAPLRAYGDLMPIIIDLNLSQQDVQLIAAVSSVPLAVCRSRIALLRQLSLVQAGNLQLAAAQVVAANAAVDDNAFNTMQPLVLNGVPGLALANLTSYISGAVIYANLAHDILFGILENNGALAANMLQRFNEKMANAPGMTWGQRNDLAGAGAGQNLYAPLSMGAWDIGFEIISDIFGWRGAGASHGCFTFAEIDDARQRALNTIPFIQLNNQSRDLVVSGRNVRIVLNRGQSLIVTMFTF
jgi:hypothetical protein